jgi:hypothetical protein
MTHLETQTSELETQLGILVDVFKNFHMHGLFHTKPTFSHSLAFGHHMLSLLHIQPTFSYSLALVITCQAYSIFNPPFLTP